MLIRVPQDYQTINDAVKSAKHGDTIFVKAGRYYEVVEVNGFINLQFETDGKVQPITWHLRDCRRCKWSKGFYGTWISLAGCSGNVFPEYSYQENVELENKEISDEKFVINNLDAIIEMDENLVKMPPIEERKIKVKIKSMEKAKPKIIEKEKE